MAKQERLVVLAVLTLVLLIALPALMTRNQPKPMANSTRFTYELYDMKGSNRYVRVITDNDTGCKYIADGGGLALMPNTCR
jgi:hypothetical protein